MDLGQASRRFLTVSITCSLLIVTVAFITGGQSLMPLKADTENVRSGSSDWGDYDNDGDLDLVLTGKTEEGRPTTLIYENQGGGSFEPIGTEITGVVNGEAKWGDYDGDGDLDLALVGRKAGGDERGTIWENQGNGRFDASPISSNIYGVENASADWGDYDRDGDLDLVLTGEVADGSPTTTIYENQASGKLEPIGAGVTGVVDGEAEWGDFDGDGDLDLALVGRKAGGDERGTIWENQGSNRFEASPVSSEVYGVEGASADWGDYDRDGDLDLVLTGEVADGSPTTTVYENQAGRALEPVRTRVTGVVNGSASWGDYDGDGDLDLALVGRKAGGDERGTIWENQGNGRFDASPISSNIYGVENASADWGDYDRDGDLDLVLTGETADRKPSTTIYENQ